MIKLTINPYLEATVFKTTHTHLTIGCDDHVDLDLGPDVAFLRKPVEIIEEHDSHFVVVPFFDSSITLNGQPVLSKEKLVTGDLLNIGSVEILFETPKKTSGDGQIAHLASLFDVEEACLTDAEIDSLLLELDNIEKKAVDNDPPEQEAELTLTAQVTVLPEEESPALSPPLEDKSPVETIPNSSFPKTAVFLFLLIFCLSSASYLFIKRENAKSELDAARGLADLSMAITHARLVHSPLDSALNDENWLDDHLRAILSPSYRDLSPLTQSGKLQGNRYQFKTFSTSDFSHSILLAIPTDTIIQRLIPKNSFIVDSKAMEIRQTENLSDWLPLILNEETLDSYTATEIADMMGNADRVPLSYLDAGRIENGFTPPKTLFDLKPHLAHLIYNAPRYYLFTKPLFDKALELKQKEHHELHEVASLLHLINAYTSLPDLLLYTAENSNESAEIYAELKKFAPQHQFLLGNISLSPETGLISHTQITQESEFNDLSENELPFMAEPQTEIQEEPSSDTDLTVFDESALHDEESELQQHIDHISHLLNDRQELWESLLIAEKSYCDIPEETLRSTLKALPLIVGQENKDRFDRYLEKKLSLLANERDMVHQSEEKILLLIDLNEIIDDTKKTQESCAFLRQEMDAYIERLSRFVFDLSRSREEGCFLNNKAFHQSLLHSIKQKLKKAKKMRVTLIQTTDAIYSLCLEQEQLAKEQLEAVENSLEYSQSDLQYLQQRFETLTTGGMIVDSMYELGEKLQEFQ